MPRRSWRDPERRSISEAASVIPTRPSCVRARCTLILRWFSSIRRRLHFPQWCGRKSLARPCSTTARSSRSPTSPGRSSCRPRARRPRRTRPSNSTSPPSGCVSRDEEHIEAVAFAGVRCLDLQARAHNYLLLVLARQRLADREAGLPEAEQGSTGERANDAVIGDTGRLHRSARSRRARARSCPCRTESTAVAHGLSASATGSPSSRICSILIGHAWGTCSPMNTSIARSSA